jgi:hypothetical protein
VKLDLLFTDGEIAVVQLLGHGVKAIAEIEVDERTLLVLHLIERRSLLELAAQVGELVVAPYLLKAKGFALRLIPGVIEVEIARILAPVLLSLRLFGLQLRCLRCFGSSRLLLRLIQFGGRHEHRKLRQPVFCRLVAGSDEHFGIEVGIYMQEIAEGVRATVDSIHDEVDGTMKKLAGKVRPSTETAASALVN